MCSPGGSVYSAVQMCFAKTFARGSHDQPSPVTLCCLLKILIDVDALSITHSKKIHTQRLNTRKSLSGTASVKQNNVPSPKASMDNIPCWLAVQRTVEITRTKAQKTSTRALRESRHRPTSIRLPQFSGDFLFQRHIYDIVFWNGEDENIVFTSLHNAVHATRSSHEKAVRPFISLSNAWILTKQKKVLPIANVNSCSRSLYVVVCPSVCLSSVCLSVCNVRAPYSVDWNFRQCFCAI